MNYQPTPEQEQALREWLQAAIVPLIEQVLVKKLGQAMSFASQEVIKPRREWQGLTEAEKVQTAIDCGCADVAWIGLAEAIEAKLKEKNA